MSAIQQLKDVIKTGDYEKTLEAMEQLRIALMTDGDTIRQFLQPVEITELHELLEQTFDVPARIMRVRRRVPVAKSRAVLFLQAMKIALIKTRP